MPFACPFHHLTLSIIDIKNSIQQVRHGLLFLPSHTNLYKGSQSLLFPLMKLR